MKAAFIFSGQGAQSVGMGKDIFEKSPAGRSVYEKADEVLNWKVSEICFEGPAVKPLLPGGDLCNKHGMSCRIQGTVWR